MKKMPATKRIWKEGGGGKRDGEMKERERERKRERESEREKDRK
jgi:hypothetical protein